MSSSFKNKFSVEKREEESARIRSKYPDRVPIIAEISQVRKYLVYSEKLPNLDKQKFLVPKSLTVGQFQYVIRKRIKLPAEKAVYMLFGEEGTLVPTSANIGDIYNEFADKDDSMLYLTIVGENTFGN